MAPSEEYVELKRLVHEEELPVERVERRWSKEDGDWAKVEFKDEGNTVIESSEEDFVFAATQLNTVVREGEEMFVDLTSRPVGGTDGFYSNIEHFTPEDREYLNGDKSRLEVGLEALQSEEEEEPEEIGLIEALDASIDKDTENEELLKVIEHYDAALALQWTHVRDAYEAMENTKEDIAEDIDRFEVFLDDAFDILRKGFLETSPINGYRKYRDITITDSIFLLNKMGEVRNKTHQEWKSLAGEGDGSIDGEIAMPRVLDEYARHYELAKDPLRDLAATVDYEDGFENVDLSDSRDVIRFLKRNNHQNLVGTVVPQLRNGPSHMSININEDDGIVEIFNQRGRNREIEKKISFDDLVEKQKKMRDLSSAIIIATAVTEQLVIFRYLDSPDFIYRIIENTDPDVLAENIPSKSEPEDN